MAVANLEFAASNEAPNTDAAHSSAASSLSSDTNPKNRRPLDYNEFGIVIPPPYQECFGEDCTAQLTGDIGCGPSRHHIESTHKRFNSLGSLSSRFKELELLTVWLPRCVHTDFHDDHELEATPPSPKIMKRAIKQGSFIQRIVNNTNEIEAVQAILYSESAGRAEKKLAGRHLSSALKSRKEVLKGLDFVEIFPEELVTGALLAAAPGHARSRIMQGSKFVLTGTMRRDQVPLAAEFGKQVLSEKESYWAKHDAERALQTSVKQLQLQG